MADCLERSESSGFVGSSSMCSKSIAPAPDSLLIEATSAHSHKESLLNWCTSVTSDNVESEEDHDGKISSSYSVSKSKEESVDNSTLDHDARLHASNSASNDLSFISSHSLIDKDEMSNGLNEDIGSTKENCFDDKHTAKPSSSNKSDSHTIAHSEPDVTLLIKNDIIRVPGECQKLSLPCSSDISISIQPESSDHQEEEFIYKINDKMSTDLDPALSEKSVTDNELCKDDNVKSEDISLYSDVDIKEENLNDYESSCIVITEPDTPEQDYEVDKISESGLEDENFDEEYHGPEQTIQWNSTEECEEIINQECSPDISILIKPETGSETVMEVSIEEGNECQGDLASSEVEVQEDEMPLENDEVIVEEVNLNEHKESRNEKTAKKSDSCNLDLKTDPFLNSLDGNLHNQLKNSKCTIRLVSEKDRKSGSESKRSRLEPVESKRSNDNIVEGLEKLTGTVKIGCLSVTPLDPSFKQKCSREAKPEVMVDETHYKSKDRIGNDSSIIDTHKNCVRDEKRMKNSSDITISPKDQSLSYLDSVETLKVKIPQLIDSFTGKVRREERQYKHKLDRDGGINYNNNLRILQHYLVERGMMKEASALQGRLDSVKPYLKEMMLQSDERFRNAAEFEDARAAEFVNSINRIEGKRRETTGNDSSTERELAALTEKFLSSANSGYIKNFSRNMDYRDVSRYAGERNRSYDSYYGKQYYEGLEYLAQNWTEPVMPHVYRSSRHVSNDNEINSIPPDLTMYNQFLPEFDNQINPSTLIGTSSAFCTKDFSSFIDEETAEKYNNFVHFMVGEMEALSFDAMDQKKRRDCGEEKEYKSGDNCQSSMPQMMGHSPYQSQYPMMPQAPSSHLMNYSQLHSPLSPAMLPLPIDSSSEKCSQLTITPLDESGKPVIGAMGASDSLTDNCCSPASLYLPPLAPPPSQDLFSQQLTITPLLQPTNLPYLPRSSFMRRRGRPPMDPGYGPGGYRRDGARVPRLSDYPGYLEDMDRHMLRSVPRSSGVSRSQLDHLHTPLQPSQDSTRISRVDTAPLQKELSADSRKSEYISESKKPLGPTSTVSSVVNNSGFEVSSLTNKELSRANSCPSQDIPSKSPNSCLSSQQSSLSNVSSSSSNHHNGYRKSDFRPRNVTNQEIKAKTAKTVDPKHKTTFHFQSKHVKIKPDSFLHNKNVKITLGDKTDKKTPSSQTNNKSDDEKLPQLVSMLNKDSKELKTNPNNSTSSILQNINRNKEETNCEESNLNQTSNEDILSDVDVKEEIVITTTIDDESTEVDCVASDTLKVGGDRESQGVSCTSELLTDSNLSNNNNNKVKKKRRYPFLKKKKKRGKASVCKSAPQRVKTLCPVKSEKVKVSPKKQVVSPVMEKSMDGWSQENSSSDVSLSNSSSRECEQSGAEGPDGIRRSGRKRKIIEGNPKFKDMERVDLKYFREERLKPTSPPVKRKLESKQSTGKSDNPQKRRVIITKTKSSKQLVKSSVKVLNPLKMSSINRTTDSSNRHEPPRTPERQDPTKTQAKLEQFLQVNDIYLKPQTFL